MGAPGVWHFYLRRLHSLTGIFPIGVFLVEHFFGNAFATRGPEAYILHPAQGLGARYHSTAFLLQRITGIILLVYISYHVWNTRVQVVFFGQHVDYAYMARYFAPTYEKAVYIVGILCACYHFAHGLFNFAYKWGITVSARAQRAMTYISLAVFAAMSAVGIHILFRSEEHTSELQS